MRNPLHCILPPGAAFLFREALAVSMSIFAENTQLSALEESLNMCGWGFWSEEKHRGRELGIKAQPCFKYYQPVWRETAKVPVIESEYAEELDRLIGIVCKDSKYLGDVLKLRYAFGMSSRKIAEIMGLETRQRVSKNEIINTIRCALDRIYALRMYSNDVDTGGQKAYKSR